MNDTQAPNQSSTAPSKTLVAGYSLGSVGIDVAQHSILYHLNPVYTVLLGVSPVYLGNVISASRMLDLILDPLVANASDTSRSKWGRRKPFFALGSVFTLLFFLSFFFYPPTNGFIRPEWYVAIVLVCFYIGFSPAVIGYSGLLPEISKISAERTTLLTTQTRFRYCAMLLTVWALPIAGLAIMPSFETGLRLYAGALVILLRLA